MNFVEYFCHANEVDNNVYRPSTSLYRYIDWTFTATFTSVFVSFLMIYLVLCVLFGALLLWAGNAEPDCIVASGEPFGKSENPNTAWSDAFALSWTTFTTVVSGNMICVCQWKGILTATSLPIANYIFVISFS